MFANLLAAISIAFTMFLPAVSASEQTLAIHSITVEVLDPVRPGGPPRLFVRVIADPDTMSCVSFVPPASSARPSICFASVLDPNFDGIYDGDYFGILDAPGLTSDWHIATVDASLASDPHRYCRNTIYYAPSQSEPRFIMPPVSVLALDDPIETGHIYSGFPRRPLFCTN